MDNDNDNAVDTTNDEEMIEVLVSNSDDIVGWGAGGCGKGGFEQ